MQMEENIEQNHVNKDLRGGHENLVTHTQLEYLVIR